ncbi:hypothetical protein SOCEGT47_081240 [Sorangium cellulosum]|uniref:DUF4351 domain-containing protein n=1 Tax=Sorangium cellulosum TaxID=56 RepID=A0A4P2QCQ3_SORCE|nr:hypothetical protein [Sorangium cellulosum]AUX27530.1 hypothetical protein SOCEGT47_081240 [Sorangium cellulosum]
MPISSALLHERWYHTRVGKLDRFAKVTFAEETARVTRGAAAWHDAPEVRLERVQADGYLRVLRPEELASLAAPWPEAREHDEALVELKMAGDHVDVVQVKRALLRRQAREVERVEERDPPWMGEQPLWFVAPHLPAWLRGVRVLESFSPGCYRVGPSPFQFLWIAANELPLRDELVPFLVARSGRPLDEFARWVAPRRKADWVFYMLQYMPMSPWTREELEQRFARSDDPEVEARRQEILQTLLAHSPDVKERLIEQGVEKGLLQGTERGQLIGARAALRRVLARRGLALTSTLEAQIDGCSDLATLERWLDQAVSSASAEEALA